MLCMAASMSSSLAFAQSKITGVVKDSTGEPIIGASVTIKGAQGVGAVTDIDGNFSLTVAFRKKTALGELYRLHPTDSRREWQEHIYYCS